jgi:hypothetical protein
MKIGPNQYTANDGSVHLTQGFAHLHDMHRAQQRAHAHDMHRAQQRAHAHDMQRTYAGFLRRSNDLHQPLRPNLRSGYRPFSTIGRFFRFVVKACIIITILWIFIAGNGLAIVARIVDSFTSAMHNSPPFVAAPSPPQPGFVVIPPFAGIDRASPAPPPPVIWHHPMAGPHR